MGFLPGDYRGFEAPPDKSVRKITAREAAHIAWLTEAWEDRDAAFLFSLAQSVNHLAKQKHARTKAKAKPEAG